MPRSLFKRSAKGDKGGVDILVPGGGRTRRTVAKVRAPKHPAQAQDAQTLPHSSSDSSSHRPPTFRSVPSISDFVHAYNSPNTEFSSQHHETLPTSIASDKSPQDETHSLINEMEQLSHVVKGLGSAKETPREKMVAQRDVFHPSAAINTLPPRLSQGFSKLNEAVAFFCDDTAGWTLQNWPFEDAYDPTTEHVADLEALKASFPQGNAVPSLILSRRNSPRPLDDVINYGLRSIISKALHQEIFDPFHPSLSLRIGGEEGARCSAYFKELHNSTRSQEDDIDIMSWRAGTFKALEIQAGRDFEATFIKDLSSALIKDHIFPFLQAIFGDRMNIFPVELKGITNIVRAAFEWNRSIKCLVPPFDLRTFVVPNDALFDAAMMEYYEKPMSASRTKTIICAGCSGLQLFDHEHPNGRVLVKVKVLAPQNYGDA